MVRVLVLVIVLAVGSAGFAVPGAAQVPGFAYDRELRIVVRETLWHAVSEGRRIPRSRIDTVYVRCYRDRTSFESVFERRFRLSARRVVAYYAGGGDIHLRRLTCENARAFLRGRHTIFTSAAFSILVHEALHRQGIRNERVTTCFSNDAVRWGALWLGFDEERALRARNLAIEYTKRYSPPTYWMGKPTCLALARNRDWTEFTSDGQR